ncbi:MULTISPECIES: hypothetical protein [unclassified Crossiella]|uniref:hypothetical protein n=1 Tax=unclassified Crossiella TaxID=2620835 RepID=UPI001FFFCB45|nr:MULTISPECIES: hypothetical protein [unclassified Crossiella]MCK2243043.1 hypothetical protein [Crossiella sp. S99.2]MCK2256920.1 hypothetical protein [Crossiella sp. S99.1]
MIEQPDLPPAVVVHVEAGAEAEYAVRPAFLIDRGAGEDIIATATFGELRITTTQGLGEATAHRPHPQITKAPVEDNLEG